MRVIYPNLDFEDRLAGRSQRTNAVLQRTVACLSPFLGLLGQAGDAVVVTESGKPDDLPAPLSSVRFITMDELTKLRGDGPADWKVVPWGWDAEARHLAKSLGHSDRVPAEDAVAEVNSRRFSAEFDAACDGPHDVLFDGRFGQVCRSESEFLHATAELVDLGFNEWLAKPAWSGAARSRLPGRRSQLNSSQAGWLRRQLKDCGYVWLEPTLTVLRECGIQLQIGDPASSDGNDVVEVLGVTEMLTDAGGRFRGSVISETVDPVWQSAVAAARAAGRQAAERGYFGPLGIDCMQVLLPDGRRIVRACHDINGRCTMGRLALQLRPLVEAGETGIWLHGRVGECLPSSESRAISPAIEWPDDVEAARLSPRLVGGQPTEVESWLYIVNSHQKYQNLLEILRETAGIRKVRCESRWNG